MPCAGCSPQHFAEGRLQVVMVVPWPHQLAEGKAIQLADITPVGRRELHPPRGSRIGAWASKQSRPLESRFALEKEVAKFTAKYPVGDIPRPPHWSGFRISPVYIEFWKDGAFRLHDRIIFRRAEEGEAWTKTRFYP